MTMKKNKRIARRLEVRHNNDELLIKAQDYFRMYPKVNVTETDSSILKELREELRFHERKVEY